ncbi:MAG: T9SS type A sorting domain-containing protein, partial [Candidatus Marinimicrobia bacterium]|nr:T9SS type A sorting domain-containing protein [Candidatus Neomarinimicrobiota bacterium]
TLQDGLTIGFTSAEPAHYVAPLAVDKINLPENFQLMPAYPNPFNPRTQITFKHPRINHINITIYDLLGRRVLTLTDGQYTAGQHTLIWNGRNSNGVPVSSGTYFVVARSAGNRQVNKLFLLK